MFSVSPAGSSLAAFSPFKQPVRKLRNAVLGVVLFAIVCSYAIGANAAPGSCDGNWHTARAVDVTQQLGDFNSLAAVSALSSHDVWAVGTFAQFAGNDYYKTLIEHYDGTRWRKVPTPKPLKPIAVLTGVSARSSDDVWAVGYEQDLRSGYRTLIEHWDGKSWKVAEDGTHQGWLSSVVAIAADDVWAVGSTDYVGFGLIEHWDGKSWKQTFLSGSIFLRGVAAVAKDDVWAVGQFSHDGSGDYTYATHFDGTRWTHVTTPSPLHKHDIDQNWLTSISALSANDVWAVGVVRDPDFGYLDRTLTEHWDGSRWSVVSSPLIGQREGNDFWATAAVGPDSVWAVGAAGNDPDMQPLSEQWNGKSWTQVITPASNGILQGLSAVPSSRLELWAVGYKVKQNSYLGTLVEYLCAPGE